MLIVMGSVFVSAFGVSFFGSKLNLHPGDSLETAYSLQNNNNGTLVIGVKIEEGGQYLTLLGGDNFEIPAEGNVAVPVRVSVPETAKIGDIYNVKVLFTQLNDVGGAGGKSTTIGLVFNQRNGFEIAVIPEESAVTEPTETKTGMNVLWVWLLVIVIVVVIVWLIVLMKKKKVEPAVVSSRKK